MRSGNSTVHYDRLCDGPLCQGNANQGYIVGDRYKCAVCYDTDFCEKCEASPQNQHNKTHPLIKFKTPIRNVTVCTLEERADGAEMPVVGDMHARNPSVAVPSSAPVGPSPPATVTVSKPISTANAATQVQTVAEVKPVCPPLPVVPAASTKDVDGDDGAKGEVSTIAEAEPSLDAHFVRDTIADGTMLPPSYIFRQTWTIRNPGPSDWPKGCSVKFVGGDNMRNLDMGHPISVADLEKSVESDMLPLDVGTGVNWCFTVTLRTPKRRGKYISYWRLTAPDGVKFGDKLWCDIDVSEDAHKIRPVAATTTDTTAGPEELVKPSTEAVQQHAATTESQSEVDTDVRDPGRVENPALFQHELRGCVMRPRRRCQHAVPRRLMDSSRTSTCARIPLRTSRQRQEEQSVEEPQVGNVEDVAEKRAEEVSLEETEPATVEQLAKKGVVVNEAEAEAEIDTVDNAETERDDIQEATVSEKPGGASATRISPTDEISSEDEDFLTDEEYDILNASDEEFVAVSQKDARR